MNVNEQILANLEQMNANMKQLVQQNAMGAAPEVMADNLGPTVPREDWRMVPIMFELAAGDTVLQTVNISQEASFDLIYITGHVTDHPEQGVAAVPVLPNLQWRINDSKTAEYLTLGAGWVHWLDTVGTQPAAALSSANAPYTLVGRRRFLRGCTVQLEFTDLSFANSIVWLVLHGIKVYAEYKDNR